VDPIRGYEYLGPPDKLSLSPTHTHVTSHSGQQLTQILECDGRMSSESRRIHCGGDGQSVENLLARRAVRSVFLARVLRKQKKSSKSEKQKQRSWAATWSDSSKNLSNYTHGIHLCIIYVYTTR